MLFKISNLSTLYSGQAARQRDACGAVRSLLVFGIRDTQRRGICSASKQVHIWHIPRCARDDSRCKWSAKSTRHLQQKHKNLVPCVAANCGTSRSTYWWEEAHAPHKRTGQGTCGRGLTLSRRRTSRSRRSVCPEEAAFATDRRVVKLETSETAVSVDFQSKEPRSTPQRITVILRHKERREISWRDRSTPLSKRDL